MSEQDEAERSGSTGEFRAFVGRYGQTEATQSWTRPAARNRTAAVTVAALVALVVVIALVAVFH